MRIKGTVSVNDSDPLNAEMAMLYLLSSLIKYELDINVFNFEN